MKKYICIIMALLAVIPCLFTGCEVEQKKIATHQGSLEVDYSSDMQIMYLCSGGSMSVPMTKSDTGYYYIGEDKILIYIDKESKKATPLCSKPNCLHEDIEICEAYINISDNISIETLYGATGNAIQYYQGSLYILCGEYDESFINYNSYIMKMDLDGGNRERFTDYFDFAVMRWCIHRGYLYYLTDSSLLRVPMDDIEAEPEVIYEAEHYVEDSQNTFKTLYAYKNYIYLKVDEIDEEGNGKGRQIFCINLDTKEKTDIKINGKFASVQAFSGNKVIVTCTDNNSKKYEIADLNGSGRDTLLTQNEEEKKTFTGDGIYYYLDNKAKAATDSDVEQVVTVLDSELNEVDTFKLPAMDLVVYNFFAPQDNECFVFESFNKKGEHILVMADKSQIGSIGGKTIKYTELCKLKWKKDKANEYYGIG